MTMRRFFIAFAVALLAQASVFALYYDDLIYLRRSVPEIVAGPRETFVRHAADALTRSRLTRRHLDTIAESAQGFALTDVEIAALERRLAAEPESRAVQFRLADALRRNGEFVRAESLYLSILSTVGKEVR